MERKDAIAGYEPEWSADFFSIAPAIKLRCRIITVEGAGQKDHWRN
jgi:hypothetical protein